MCFEGKGKEEEKQGFILMRFPGYFSKAIKKKICFLITLIYTPLFCHKESVVVLEGNTKLSLWSSPMMLCLSRNAV